MTNSLRPLLSPLCLTLVAVVLMALPSSAFAFEVWAFIEINGSPLPGVASGNSLKDGGIPLNSFGFSVSRPIGAGGVPQGASQKSAITITKALDGASPLLFKAVTNNEVVNSGLFKFFRPNPTTGVEEIYYEVQISNGLIGSQVVVGGVNDEMEAVKLYFLTLEQTSPIAGTSHIN